MQVASIKRGMWDSLYDKFQTFQNCGVTNRGTENCADSICIEVESPERIATNLFEKVCESGELYASEIFVFLARCYNLFSFHFICSSHMPLTSQYLKIEKEISNRSLRCSKSING